MRTIDVRHDGLGKFRRIVGYGLVEQKVAAQHAVWDKQWQRRRALEHRHFAGPNAATLQALKRLQADEQSEDAGRELLSLATILLNAVRPQPVTEWKPLSEHGEFSELPPAEPKPLQLMREPRKADFMPGPPRNLVALLQVGRRRRQREAALASFKAAHDEWDYAVRWVTQEHDTATKKYRAALADWDARKSAFHAAQAAAATRLEALQRRYAQKDPEAVVANANLVLLAADRPDGFPKHWQIDFTGGVTTVDYELPSTDQLPSVKKVKYAAARDAFEAVGLAECERDQLYAEALYQTCLAVVHLLFASDAAEAIEAVTFNGWVNFIDKSNGRPARACVMSLQTTKEDFRRIDLASVDPQACFKSLNGVASSKLAAMTAVRN
ncbi:MAG: hypothetical protein KGJ79_13480 [Alphaproteobacteria bacterium]|nr:hypothetical protein [Alphaproteobacteria bacterium]